MELLRSYAQQLQKMNGTTDSNGMPSQGAQELAQKVNENEKTGIFLSFIKLFKNLLFGFIATSSL